MGKALRCVEVIRLPIVMLVVAFPRENSGCLCETRMVVVV